MKKYLAPILLASLLLTPLSADEGTSGKNFSEVVRVTAAMVHDQNTRTLVNKHGLQVLNVTWEDTGRYKNSSVGPNISDMTLQVQQQDPKTDELSLTCLPVIRHDNFTDKTADIALDDFFLLVGNEDDQDLKKVSLREYLGNIRRYLTKPKSWKGKKTSLLAERDSHALVSAQACFLPIPKGGEVEFNPVLFNYQSRPEDPAVLTVLVTREGTSTTIIDNQRDGFAAGRTWGQRLFFNQNGERASLTGTRLSDFMSKGATDGSAQVEAAGQEGLNMVLLIQVPLKQKQPMNFAPGGAVVFSEGAAVRTRSQSTTENAVIGHGKVEGPFTEIDNLDIERDERFPVRVTVQFYKATENGVVSESDIEDIAQQIDRVYAQGDYVGSLVTGGETERPTEYYGNKIQPDGWWKAFFQRHHENFGEDWTGVEELFEELDLKAR